MCVDSPSSLCVSLHVTAFQVFVWSYALQGAGVSLFLIIGILVLLFILFPDSIFIISGCHFLSFIHLLHCVRYLYVILQWYWFIVLDFVACSGYFRLSVCMWVFFCVHTSLAFVATPFPRILGSGAWQLRSTGRLTDCEQPTLSLSRSTDRSTREC